MQVRERVYVQTRNQGMCVCASARVKCMLTAGGRARRCCRLAASSAGRAVVVGDQPHHRALAAWGSVVERQPTPVPLNNTRPAPDGPQTRQSHVFYVLYVGLQFLTVVTPRLGFGG